MRLPASIALVPQCLARRAFPLAMAGVVGCGATPLYEQRASYILESINGDALPAVVVETATTRRELTEGNVDLAEVGTYTIRLTYRETTGGAASTSVEACVGSYSIAGQRITFTEVSQTGTACGDSYSGTLEGESLVIAFDADVRAAFRRVGP